MGSEMCIRDRQASHQTSFVTEYSTLLRKKKERTPGHIRTYFAAHARNSAICFSVSGTVGELSSQVFLFSTIKLVSVILSSMRATIAFYLHLHISLLSLHKKLPCFSIFISKKTGQSHTQSSALCCSTPCACHCSTVQFRKTPGTR